MGEEEFWLVWNPQGNRPPSRMHISAGSAAREAERLAAQNPGNSFYVLHAIEARRTPPVEVVVLLKREDDGIPF